jgi:DNA-binding SARP family transcriptional activator
MARLVLTLLGGFEARLGDGPPLALPTRKTQALLAYLALPPGRAHPRDKLAALLWGDLGDAAARNSLRQALFALRRALAPADPPCLAIESDTLALHPAGVEVDVAAFEREVADGTPEALERATARYQGDLLAGLRVEDAPFEEWLMTERERLRELALEALAKLLAHQRDSGAAEAAIQTALKLLAVDPLQEPVCRTLMRLYAQVGRRGAALRQYQHCVATLQRELGVEPEADTKALYREILRGRPRPVPPGRSALEAAPPGGDLHGGLPEAPCIGREPELARLRAGLEALWAGQGGLMLIAGEAGIGKTRLLAELAADAVRRGGRLLLGRCHDGEQLLPFGPWVDALRAGRVDREADQLGELGSVWLGEVARLVPEMESSDARLARSTDYRQLFESVRRLLGHLASRQPLVAILEDLHWADEMSVRLLGFVGRRLDRTRLLLVASVREEELTDAPILQELLDDLHREGRLDVLRLAPLSEGDTMVLVRRLGPASEGAVALARLEQDAWRTSEGNPLMVVETLREFREGATTETYRGLPFPERVRELLTRRLARLGEQSRILVAAASAIGREFEFTVLQKAGGLGESETAASLEELVRRRLLHGVGEHFEFTHDRIREVAYGQLLQPRRKLLHRHVAEAIEAVYGSHLDPHCTALGRHYREAETWDKAVTYLRRAGHQALGRAAHREAAASFDQAIAALAHLPKGRAEAELAIDLRLDLRDALFPLPEWRRVLDQLLEAEAIARRIGDRRRLGLILTAVSIERRLRGQHTEALDAGRTALGLAGDIGSGDVHVIAIFRVGQALHALGACRQAREALEDAARSLLGDGAHRRFGGAGSGPLYGLVCVWLCWTLGDLGEFQEGDRWGHAALQMAEASAHAYSLAHACFGLGFVRLRRGDLEGAITVLERGWDLSEARDFWVLGISNASELGYAYCLAGRIDEARRLLAEVLARATALGLRSREALWLGWSAAAELAAGEPGLGMEHARTALRLARERQERGVEAEVLWIAGEIARHLDPERPSEAEHHYLASLALAEELGMRPQEAHCHLSLGVLRRSTGRLDEGRAALQTATALYQELDMPFWLTRAEAELARSA